MAVPLRVYRGPDEDESILFGDRFEYPPEPSVRVRLGDLLPLVSMAQKMKFIWLKDFLDDEVTITDDLHEVLQSFRGSLPHAG